MNFFKGRAILWLLIPIAFVVAFFWDGSEPKKAEFIQQKSNPDFYLLNTHTTEFNQAGNKVREFNSDKTLYFKFSQQTKLEKPILNISSEKQQSWQVKANNAISKELSNELILEGQVQIEMLREANQSITLLMDRLTIDFASEVAFTNSDIVLNGPSYRLTASGMDVDLKNNTIEFKSKVISEEL